MCVCVALSPDPLSQLFNVAHKKRLKSWERGPGDEAMSVCMRACVRVCVRACVCVCVCNVRMSVCPGTHHIRWSLELGPLTDLDKVCTIG